MKKDFCEIIAILDRSGSMGSLAKDVIGGYNNFINEQKKLHGEVNVTLVLFDHEVLIPYAGMNINHVPELTNEVYFARGSTALLDSIGKTFNQVGAKLASTQEDQRPEKVIVMVNTDGEENASKEFNVHQIKNMIKHQEEKYNWEILFLGANIDSVGTARGMGFANLSNVADFQFTKTGVKAGFAAYSSAVSSIRSTKMSLNTSNSMDVLYKTELKKAENN